MLNVYEAGETECVQVKNTEEMQIQNLEAEQTHTIVSPKDLKEPTINIKTIPPYVITEYDQNF